jgi:hypothetical protein
MHVILVFDIAFPVDPQPALKPFVAEQMAGMQSFEQNGMLVFEKVFLKVCGYPAPDNKRFHAEVRFQVVPPGVIIHADTEIFKFLCRFPVVFKAVKHDPDACIMKRSDLVINIDHSSVIRRIRDVKGNDM